MYHLKFDSFRSGGASAAGCSGSRPRRVVPTHLPSVLVSQLLLLQAHPACFSNRLRQIGRFQSTIKKNTAEDEDGDDDHRGCASTSLREGVTTLRISPRTSLRKLREFFHRPTAPSSNFGPLVSCAWLTPASFGSAVFVAASIAAQWSVAISFLVLSRPASLAAHAPSIAHPVGSNLAGAEGFEPPSSVLETDSLAVELTPLKQGLVVSDSDQFFVRIDGDLLSRLCFN
jgi:hypothetical protein